MPTVKHGGGNIIFWGCFADSGVGPLVKINGIMKKEQYKKILEDNLKDTAANLQLGHQWTFMQDNDPKHTSKLVKNWLESNRINVLEWPAQSPDLNPIENLWRTLKVRVQKRNPTNFTQLEDFCQDEWHKLTQTDCNNLIKHYYKRLEAVIKNKGNAIDY